MHACHILMHVANTVALKASLDCILILAMGCQACMCTGQLSPAGNKPLSQLLSDGLISCSMHYSHSIQQSWGTNSVIIMQYYMIPWAAAMPGPARVNLLFHNNVAKSSGC